MYSGGNGTLVNPYLIANVTDLKNIESNMSSYFKQINDITLGNFEPIGYNSGDTNGTPFTGRYDGNNYTIKDGIINYPTLNRVGLWRYSQGVHVNMKLKNLSITGKQYVGAIVGYFAAVDNNTYYENVHTDSDCNIAGYADYIGGLIGYSYAGSYSNVLINACSNKANLVSGTHTMGGITGKSCAVKIHNCYNEGSIYCLGNNVGGIVGYFTNSSWVTTSTIKYCYNAGSISGVHRCGGIVGAFSCKNIANCYALNSSIIRISGTSANFGRVAGGPVVAEMTNNYAYVDMQFYI